MAFKSTIDLLCVNLLIKNEKKDKLNFPSINWPNKKMHIASVA